MNENIGLHTLYKDDKMQHKYFFLNCKMHLQGHANPKLVFGMEIKEARNEIELDQYFTKYNT